MTTKYKISITFEDKRKKITKKHFNELAQDHRYDNPKEIYKIKMFYATIDIVAFQIKNRFLGLKKGIRFIFIFNT